MSELMGIISGFVHHILFAITVIVFTTYLGLMIYSAISLRKYMRKNSYVDYNSIIPSPIVPSISVIVPAYNESLNIVDNIRTLLSLYYNDFEIVVINDGSTDDTLEKVISAYELEKVNYFFDYRIPCERVRGVYKSVNRSYKKLTFVDKRNGGKADALNAGLNVVRNDLIVSIDADSIIEQDALMKLVKPFLEEKDKKVIAAGGVIRIANNCEISSGRIRTVRLPKKWLPRAQVMEYTRSFLMGRIAWSELDGLLLISGAMGMFDREIVIESGGYSTKTVGEDMEIVVRIRRYMAERDLPYHVEYIPDPLCWTEVPSTVRSLAKQRSRWTRGTMETLWEHRKLFLNRKYGKLGMMGYPYWLFFEWLAPLVEFIGILVFTFLAITGRLNVPFFLLLLGFVYFFAVSLSIYSVLFEEITFHKYEKRRDIVKLILTAFLEPLFFHPLVLIMSIKGNIDKLLKVTSWGGQERRGFSQSAHRRVRWEVLGKQLRAAKYPLIIGFSSLAALVLAWLIFRGAPEKMSGESPLTRTETVDNQAFALENPPLRDNTVPAIEAESREPAPVGEAGENAEPPETEQPVETTGHSEPAPEDQGESPSAWMSPDAAMPYHIILGSFASGESTGEYVDKLRDMGFAPIPIPGDDLRTRIALHSAASWQEALSSLERIRTMPGMERAWIWKMD